MKKADNFDASKWLVENKITTQSRLNENESLDPLKPQSPEEELLSSPKEVEDNEGNIVTLIGLETKTAHGDNGVYWDSEGNRYALYKGHLTKYEMNREETIEFRKERAKTNHYFDTLKEEKPTNDMVKDYWSIMVENQPEDVIEILVGLTNGDLPFEKFSSDTANDVYDSFKDESYGEED